VPFLVRRDRERERGSRRLLSPFAVVVCRGRLLSPFAVAV
jgi:hypothetical protein